MNQGTLIYALFLWGGDGIFAAMKYWIPIGWLLLLVFGGLSQAQAQEATLRGKVIDQLNSPISDASIEVLTTRIQTRSAADGSFRLSLPAGPTYRIRFSHSGFKSTVLELFTTEGRTYVETVKMLTRAVDEVDILGEKDPTSIDDRESMLVSPIRMEDVLEMPTISPSVESLMKGMPGVATNNEFSSQYQVRGGNFDENLVYVNGIEIYRPFLARAGQQEGLGFSNPSMAQNLRFSTGGFGAQYGDKLSSVLDITYRQPKSFKATAEVGIITTNLHAEGISKNKKDPTQAGRWTYLLGARRFAMSYFLNQLETRGDYRPSFMDAQGMFTFTPKRNTDEPRIRTRANGAQDTLYSSPEKLKLTGFFAVTRNRYLFEPTGRETTTGTIQRAFRLRVAFEGRELSTYTTGLGALMLTHRPHSRLRMDYILTGFQTQETERFDVEGGYLLGEVNTNFGDSEFNEAEFDLGIGTEFRHARNFLTANVLSAQVKGSWASDNDVTHRLRFGAKYQFQQINDDLKEYSALDSAGYLVNVDGNFGLVEYIRGQANLNSNQYKAYLQHEWQMSPRTQLLTGIRGVYYDLIDAWMISPRIQMLIKLAEDMDGETRARLRLATGMYQQAPFYREFRRLDGTVNLDVKPQQSIHGIVGLDYRFYSWKRPFRLFAEAYYKQMYNLIPFEIQNVRIRYYPDEVANGYAYGLDARLNGEFIRGVDSWVSIGLLKTEEDVIGDDQGYVPRPTDQRFTFAMYFQDELPINPTYKVHLNYTYGSGMRFGPPNTFDDRTSRGFPAYHRADIGFSKLITLGTPGEARSKTGLESIWITLEIFNLLQRENTVSYVWIKDLQNNRYAIPNRLSARLINLRVIVKLE